MITPFSPPAESSRSTAHPRRLAERPVPSLSGCLRRDLPDNPARIPGSEHSCWDVSGYDTSGPDDRLRADFHTGADDNPTSDSYIRADLDGLGELLLAAKFGVHRVRGGVDLHDRTEQREVANLHHAHVEDHAVEVEEDPLPQQDVRSVIAKERRLH